eukprot:6060976-Amphidinium_carterae.1
MGSGSEIIRAMRASRLEFSNIARQSISSSAGPFLNLTPISQTRAALKHIALARRHGIVGEAGFHEHGARLQSLSPASYEMRIEHNTDPLAASRLSLRASLGPLPQLKCTWAKDMEEKKQPITEQICPLGGESRAFELGCHLMPINSIGYGGASFTT